jgi:hypothetical protein
MIALVLCGAAVVLAVVGALIAADYGESDRARRREIDRLMRIESARKAWEASLDLRPVDWNAVRRENGGDK